MRGLSQRPVNATVPPNTGGFNSFSADPIGYRGPGLIERIIMLRVIMGALILVISPCWAAADQGGGASQAPAIRQPDDGEEYSRLVAQAAAHDQNTDFHALRFAWLSSAARKRQSEITLGSVTKEMMTAAQANDHGKVRDKAVELLSAQYSDVRAHLYLSHACDLLRDSPCAEQARFVALGLMQSIMKSGDGKSCDTGWDVALISEEYTVLSIMGLQMQQQALISGQHPCDAMTAKNEKGESVTYFFKIDRIMADEMDRFGLKKP
jgi:hypothetical protein